MTLLLASASSSSMEVRRGVDPAAERLGATSRACLASSSSTRLTLGEVVSALLFAPLTRIAVARPRGWSGRLAAGDGGVGWWVR